MRLIRWRSSSELVWSGCQKVFRVWHNLLTSGAESKYLLRKELCKRNIWPISVLQNFFQGKGAKNMNSMFGPETKFFKVTNQIGNILLVSVLWLIGCIPVITIGTSTIAMYYAMVKAVRCEEGYVTKEFFRSYRQNLKTGIVLTVIFPGLAAVLWLCLLYTSPSPRDCS